LIARKLFRQSGGDIDFAEVEAAVVEFTRRFTVMAVAFDPWQLIGLSQRFSAKGVKMAKMPQTQANQTASTHASLSFSMVGILHCTRIRRRPRRNR
jgi:phage terminase large subunit-like protein